MSTRVLIAGLGLMGGSLALALRRCIPEAYISGGDIDPASVAWARGRGAIDTEVSLEADDPLDHDVVFLAVPVGLIADLALRLARRLQPGSLITDVGSVKLPIHRSLEGRLPTGVSFIGGHPMAGSEVQGHRGADPHLYENAVYIISGPPGVEVSPSGSRLVFLLRAIGALVLPMDPARHDEIVSLVSHLPYVMAVSLVNALARAVPEAGDALQLAAGGFHDTTRVAACPEGVFRDILLANRTNVLAGIDHALAELGALREDLARGDGPSLGDRLARARTLRRTLPARHGAYPMAIYELTVKARDEPGFLGRLAASLGRNRINIKDFSLLTVREGEAGSILLSFEREADREGALRVLAAEGFEGSKR